MVQELCERLEALARARRARSREEAARRGAEVDGRARERARIAGEQALLLRTEWMLRGQRA